MGHVHQQAFDSGPAIGNYEQFAALAVQEACPDFPALRLKSVSVLGSSLRRPIYGPQPADLAAIPEDWPGSPPLADPSTAYGQAKRAAEHLCALVGEQHGLEIVVARCFAFVGPDLPLNVHFAIGNFIRDALTADAITVSGDGTPLRTYLDQTDLAHWLFTLLEQGRPGDAYNVGSDELISIAELAHLVRDILAPDKPVHILGQPDPSAARNRYVPDIRKAQQQLALSVTVPLADAIRRTGTAAQAAVAGSSLL